MTRTRVRGFGGGRGWTPHPKSKIAFSGELFHDRLPVYKADASSQERKKQPKAFVEKESGLAGLLLWCLVSRTMWSYAPE